MRNFGYLHLGNNVVIQVDQIVGVFDLDASTIKKNTRDYLAAVQQKGLIVNITLKLPRSFVVVQKGDVQQVYLSQLAPATLLKRNRELTRLCLI